VLVIDRSGCLVKAVKLLLLSSCDEVAVRLLPWLLVTTQHELLLTQLIVDSQLVHSVPLFQCIDEGVSLLLVLLRTIICQ